MSKKLTYDFVKKYITSQGDTLISTEYVNNRTKLTIQCGVCCKTSEQDFGNYQQKRACRHCAGNQRLTFAFVKNQIETTGEKLLSTTYKNARTPMQIQCKKCDHIYNMRYDDFRKGRRCIKCSGTLQYTYGQVKKIIAMNGDILLSDEYKNNKTLLDIICGICGHIYTIKLSNYITGNRCRPCANLKMSEERRFSYEYVQNYLQKYGDKLLSPNYTNSSIKLDVNCGNCKDNYKITFQHYLNGVRCRCQTLSKGEREIMHYLKSNNINFDDHKRFMHCVYKRPLEFDFVIKNPYFVIEYNGIQHYQPVDKFGGQTEFIETQNRDKMKVKYCKNNNIPLLIIPYWDYKNIGVLIDQFIEQQKQLKFNKHKKIKPKIIKLGSN